MRRRVVVKIRLGRRVHALRADYGRELTACGQWVRLWVRRHVGAVVLLCDPLVPVTCPQCRAGGAR